ncbi:MAG: S1-like domain-containing RNA-binding protein [Acholeplasmataceae bacterium]
MGLEAGLINELKVLRETDIAYLLVDEDLNEVFLHKHEISNQTLNENDIVQAFLYYDQKGRLSATLKTPYLTLGEKGLLKVVGKVKNLGVFLDLGINKDLLLSKDFLPKNESLWPIVDDYILVTLTLKNRLIAKIVKYNEVTPSSNEIEEGMELIGYVQELGPIGLFVYTKNGHLVLVRKDNLRKKYRLGEEVKVLITYKSKKGYEGNLSGFKEEVMLEDSELILNYLNNHNNEMPLTDKSSSDDVKEVLNISRKALKRALGRLYKEDKVTFKNNKTYLVVKDEE